MSATVGATATSRRVFAGANIKGTPAMPAASVQHDLDVVRKVSHVAGLQEFKWPWYWRVAGRVLSTKWRTWPNTVKGTARPIQGAQAILWRSALLRVVRRHSMLLHQGRAGISDDRWLRAVLSVDRVTGLRCWYASTHFVVGGDRNGDGPERQAMMRVDLAHLDMFLTDLTASGDPVVMELDGNIHPGTWAYHELARILGKYRAVTHGQRGVEYAFTIPGRTVRVVVDRAWTIPTSRLKTDHEVRLIEHHLEEEAS